MKKYNKGQISLIVLLISAVAMTIGLSVSKKTVTETKIETDEELLKQAFNAAESGVDYYLGTGSTKYTAPDGKTTADVQVQNIGGGETISSEGLVLDKNSMFFWLVNHNSDGSIESNPNPGDFYGGTSVDICLDTNFNKALKVDYFYKEGINYKVIRKGYNFDSENKTIPGFAAKRDSLAGNCNNGIKLDLLAGSVPLLVVVKPIYGNTNISMIGQAGFPFPYQGVEISSTGRAGDLSSGVNRKVKVLNRYMVPSFLLEAITAGGEVSSQ